jgi:hypothetical protein
MYPGNNSLGAFREHSYASICSLNIPGETDMYAISGLDTERTPATIEWEKKGTKLHFKSPTAE